REGSSIGKCRAIEMCPSIKDRRVGWKCITIYQDKATTIKHSAGYLESLIDCIPVNRYRSAVDSYLMDQQEFVEQVQFAFENNAIRKQNASIDERRLLSRYFDVRRQRTQSHRQQRCASL